jgi:hypothetical protein
MTSEVKKRLYDITMPHPVNFIDDFVCCADYECGKNESYV